MSKIILCVSGVFAFIVVLIGSYIISIYNAEVTLSQRYEAQISSRTICLDKIHKVLENSYNMTKESADKFIQSVVAATEGRKGGTGSLLSMKSVQESAAGIGMPLDMYTTLLASIEGEFAEFKRSQDTLIDVYREHTTFCSRFPERLFLGGKIKSPPQLIISSATSKSIESGVDNFSLGN